MNRYALSRRCIAPAVEEVSAATTHADMAPGSVPQCLAVGDCVERWRGPCPLCSCQACTG